MGRSIPPGRSFPKITRASRFDQASDLHNRGLKIRQAQAQRGLGAIPARDSVLPLRFQVLAVEALQHELITEGRFARLLSVDRLEARQVFELIVQSGDASSHGEPVEIDLAQTLD